MIISHELKFIYIHVQRTGGTTISDLLKGQLGQQLQETSQHANARTPESHLLEKHAAYYCFGFVRNPWERMLSWYSLIHKHQPKSLAEEKIRYENFIAEDQASDFTSPFFHYNQLDYFTDEEERMKVDKIFRYENFEHEIRTLFNSLKLPLQDFPKLNTTSVKNHRAYYTDKSQALIAQKCQKDIEYFNYTF